MEYMIALKAAEPFLRDEIKWSQNSYGSIDRGTKIKNRSQIATTHRANLTIGRECSARSSQFHNRSSLHKTFYFGVVDNNVSEFGRENWGL